MTEPTTSVLVVDDGIKDFSTERPPVRFKIKRSDNTYDYFDGLPDLPALLLVEFATLAERLSESELGDQPKLFSALFELILQEQSAVLFISRMSDRKEPISLPQINDIMQWTMAAYGLRPTEPSEDSSPGSKSLDGGTSSTESAPQPALTSVPSAPTVSST